MAGSWGPDYSCPTLCPQLSCLWQDYCVLCVLVLATDQGNPTVSPWWMSPAVPRPLCIPSMAVNSSTLQYRRFERCAIHPGLQCETMTQIPTLVNWTNPWHGSSVMSLDLFWWTTNKTNRVLHCTAQEIWQQLMNNIPWHSYRCKSKQTLLWKTKRLFHWVYKYWWVWLSEAKWMTAGGLSRPHLTLFNMEINTLSIISPLRTCTKHWPQWPNNLYRTQKPSCVPLSWALICISLFLRPLSLIFVACKCLSVVSLSCLTDNCQKKINLTELELNCYLHLAQRNICLFI